MKTFESRLTDLLVLLLLILSFSGCISENVIHTDNLKSDQTKDITISTRDGTKFEMVGDKYAVVASGDTLFLRGRGHRYLSEDRIEPKSIEVSIPFDSILQIVTREKTVYYYSGPILFGVAAGMIVLYIFFTNGRGLGG